MNIDVIRKDDSEEIVAVVVNNKKCYIDYDTPYSVVMRLNNHFKVISTENINNIYKKLTK